jgi:hypothetical protein
LQIYRKTNRLAPLKRAGAAAAILGSRVGGFHPTASAQFTRRSFQFFGLDAFSETDQISLRRIMNAVAGRFCDRDAYWNSRRVFREAKFPMNYFDKTGLPDDSDQRVTLFDAQHVAPDVCGIPAVHLKPYYEEGDYWAYVSGDDVGSVLTTFNENDEGRKTYRVTGDFRINVNTHWLNGKRASLDSWAGVMAHEMMHGMGHMHDKDEYRDHLGINSVQQAVRTGGDYKRGGHRPVFRCGHRQ